MAVTTTRGGTSSTDVYDYDAAHRLTAACFDTQGCAAASASIEYSYAQVGNRLTETRVGVAEPGTIEYTYDAADQLVSHGSTTFHYDADGNQTGDGSVTRVFDEFNRLISVNDGSEETTFGYDGLGNRVGVTDGGGAWDINNTLPLLIGIDDDGDRVSYLHGPSPAPRPRGAQPISATIDDTSYVLYGDAVGSITDLFDAATDELLWHTNYEPFGVPRDTVDIVSGVPEIGLGFTGEYTDPATGQLHLRARDYDATTGRFTTTDPVTPLITDPFVATYVYVANRPTALVDPSGECPWDWCDVVRELVTNGNPNEFRFGRAVGTIKGIENTALYLTAFHDPHVQEAIGWDGRLLSDRIIEKSGVDPTSVSFCGGLLVGEAGFYVGTATVGGAAGARTGVARATGSITSRAANGAADASRILIRSPRQLQSKFKHAGDFGVTGNDSKANAAEFSAAIHKHINAAGTTGIQGTYRGQSVTHSVDPSSGLNVISRNGEFVSGWRLSSDQLANVLRNGSLGGG